jgi:hypothetical protein
LQYTGTNGAGTGSPATATISVTPRVADVTATVVEGQQTAIALAPKTIYSSLTGSTFSSKGNFSFSGSTLYYTASPGTANSGDHLFYQTSSPGGTSNTGYIDITITPPANHNPVAGTDYVNIVYNTAKNFFVLNNDSDPDNDPLSITSTWTNSGAGSWVNGDKTVTYSPLPGFSGSDILYYTISDGRGGTATGVVSVTVSSPPPPNSPPTAKEDYSNIEQNTYTTIDPRRNDTDPENDALTIQSINNVYFAYGRVNGVDLTGAPADIGSVTNNGTSITYRSPFITSSGAYHSSYVVVVVQYTISDGHGGTSQNYEILNIYAPG